MNQEQGNKTMAKQTQAKKADPIDVAAQEQAVTNAQEAPQPTTALAVGTSTALAATTDDYAGFGAEGHEEAQKSDYIIPMLYVLQPNSPPVAKSDDGSVRAGMFYNNVSGRVYDPKKGIRFIPAHYNTRFVEWIPRNEDGSGGGFVGVHLPDSQVVRDATKGERVFGKIKLSDGNELVETKYLFGLVVSDDGVADPVVIPCKSTHIAPLAKFVSAMRNFRLKGRRDPLPLCAFAAKLSTERRTKGTFNYSVPVFEFANGTPDKSLIGAKDDLFVHAHDIYTSLQSGKMKVDHEATADVDDAEIVQGGDRRAQGGGQRLDENGQPSEDGDIPF
jgi:hypothetical protein